MDATELVLRRELAELRDRLKRLEEVLETLIQRLASHPSELAPLGHVDAENLLDRLAGSDE